MSSTSLAFLVVKKHFISCHLILQSHVFARRKKIERFCFIQEKNIMLVQNTTWSSSTTMPTVRGGPVTTTTILIAGLPLDVRPEGDTELFLEHVHPGGCSGTAGPLSPSHGARGGPSPAPSRCALLLPDLPRFLRPGDQNGHI
jgi:hypothetical protein